MYNFKDFPAIQWKLQNLKKLRIENPEKYASHIEKLKNLLE